MSKYTSSKQFPYDSYDIVVIALLAAVSAAAYAGIAQVWAALTAATGPLGGSFIGLFQFGHLIAFALLRKRGVAFTTSVLSSMGQLLIGDPSGAYVLGWGVFHGLGAEIVFAAAGYRKPTFFVLGLAAGVAGVLGQLYSYWLYGWQGLISLFYISLPILFLSSFLESGGLSYYIVAALRKTQLVRER